jgi:hypothetical protein
MSLDEKYIYMISRNLSGLVDEIATVGSYSPDVFPKLYVSYDVAWQSLFASLEHLQRKLGQDKYTQLVDMAQQAKAHFDKGRPAADEDEIKLGCWLMLDMGHVVRNLPPYAYPEDLYRWPRPSIN